MVLSGRTLLMAAILTGGIGPAAVSCRERESINQVRGLRVGGTDHRLTWRQDGV